jgi:hypothetical protein
MKRFPECDKQRLGEVRGGNGLPDSAEDRAPPVAKIASLDPAPTRQGSVPPRNPEQISKPDPCSSAATWVGCSGRSLSVWAPGLSGYCRRARNSSRIAASENRPSGVSAVQYVHPLVDTPEAAPLAAEGVL